MGLFGEGGAALLGLCGGGAFHWSEFCSVYLVGGEFFAGE